MDDIAKSIKAFLYDRAASPLLGAFIVAWSVWNYRFFVVLLSGMKPTEKFAAVEEIFKFEVIEVFELSVPVGGAAFDGFLVPTLAALFYLYGYPYLAKPVYKHSLARAKELRDIKQEEEKLQLLTVEQSQEIRSKLAALQGKHAREVGEFSDQISSLNSTIDELHQKLVDIDAAERGTPFDDINDADPEEYDEFLRKRVEAQRPGEFEVSNLFNKEQWSSMNGSSRQGIGRRFKKQVERGDYVGVELTGKGSGNQLIYKKNYVPSTNFKS
ncbi:DUF1413 domain-containing protein [uncultured Abyssibacter sp.]|uniref:DUF1413 domain-containing protein n=1 Tax=uncultured Abyssibacter sp. TaxID=2320202 RepID=UPI0032B11904